MWLFLGKLSVHAWRLSSLHISTDTNTQLADQNYVSTNTQLADQIYLSMQYKHSRTDPITQVYIQY